MKNHELIIHFKELSEEQCLTLEAMFRRYNRLSNIGSSRDVTFHVDGDGEFHPKLSVTKTAHTKQLTEGHLEQFTTNKFDPDYLDLNRK